MYEVSSFTSSSRAAATVTLWRDSQFAGVNTTEFGEKLKSGLSESKSMRTSFVGAASSRTSKLAA